MYVNVYVLISVVFLVLKANSCCAVFDWLFGTEEEQAENAPFKKSGIRFEVLSTDEKFLDFAKTLTDLTPLDACYQLVVYSLQKKCGELTEEELGKLSVQLLNCQSKAEDRPVFTCTAQMSLADCTKPMDATTWNTYQIVSNRARAMCYATQQLQFRRLTENTVNKLVSSAHGQLEVMKELKEGQSQLHQMATETIRKLFESQQELLVTHESLRSAQEGVFNHLSENVQQLVHEKSLIATGNKQLADMTENIKRKLDKTSEHLEEQEIQQQESNKKILEDLKQIHARSTDALEKLDKSSSNLLKNHADLTDQYQDMFGKLQRINSTVNSLMDTIATMQRDLEKRIGWLAQILGGTDDKLQLLTSCVLHVTYFLLMVVAAAFLRLPMVSRFLLLIVIISNAAAEISYNTSLDFAGMTAFLLSTSLGYWLLLWIRLHLKKGGPTQIAGAISFSPSGNVDPLSAAEVRDLANTLGRLYHSMTGSLNISHLNCNGNAVTMPVEQTVSDEDEDPPTQDRQSEIREVRRVLLSQLGEVPGPSRPVYSSPDRFSMGTRTPMTLTPRSSSRASTPSLSSRCHGSTRSGAPCRLNALTGHLYCHRHRISTS
ncbi:protein brambleberry-like [Gigantopelta aegis]|uniref:protein brambleberry-like n=1 Tax=Gigantopelta aegis TaxID=1735272 RepID=UPI001B88D0A8|nr:protein brambleberry-like [Gigantopelta aegis]